MKIYLPTVVLIFSMIGSANAQPQYAHSPESFIAVCDQTSQTNTGSIQLVERLLCSYRKTISNQKFCDDSILWSLFFYQRQMDIHSIFLKGCPQEAAYILNNPHLSELFSGFELLTKSVLEQGISQPYYVNHCMDSLLRLADAMGVICLENPESYLPVKWTANEILNRIQSHLNQTIPFPNPYPFEQGLQSPNGIISYRACQAFYQAWRIKKNLQNTPYPKVLEIGAELGRTAFYAKFFGIEDYTIVDLPMTTMASGYFLGSVLGEDQILLAEETHQDAHKKVKFITPSDFLASQETYDLIINADGFTELDPKIALAYWEKIEKSTPLFLSMNHEVNSFRVKDFIDASSLVQEASRAPYWMRNGYVEELISFKNN